MLTASVARVVAALLAATIVVLGWAAGLTHGLVATAIVIAAIYHRWREQAF